MKSTSPGYAITIRVEADTSIAPTSLIPAAVAQAGGMLTALDVVESHHDKVVIDVTCDTIDADHAQEINEALTAHKGLTVRKVSDPFAVAHAQAADLLVLKAAPLGGVSHELEIARGAGLPVVISSALDSSVGLSMGAHLAAALPELEFDCGLGTAALLAGDVTREPIAPVDGFIEVRRVEVDDEKLQTFNAEEHRYDWWLERLERTYKLL